MNKKLKWRLNSYFSSEFLFVFQDCEINEYKLDN